MTDFEGILESFTPEERERHARAVRLVKKDLESIGKDIEDLTVEDMADYLHSHSADQLNPMNSNSWDSAMKLLERSVRG